MEQVLTVACRDVDCEVKAIRAECWKLYNMVQVPHDEGGPDLPSLAQKARDVAGDMAEVTRILERVARIAEGHEVIEDAVNTMKSWKSTGSLPMMRPPAREGKRNVRNLARACMKEEQQLERTHTRNTHIVTQHASTLCDCCKRWARYGSIKAKLRRDIWKEATKELSKGHEVDFLEDVCLSHDGGLSEAANLWSMSRYFSMLVVLGLMLSNVISLVYSDWGHLPQNQEHGLAFYNSTNGMHPPPHEHFLASRFIAETVIGKFVAPDGVIVRFNDSVAVICTVELVMLFALLLQLVFVFAKGCLSNSTEVKYTCYAASMWSTLPQIATFSSMRLLHYVTPAVVSGDATKFANYSTDRWFLKNYSCQWLAITKWLKLRVTRSTCLILGFDAFLVKVNIARAHMDVTADKVSLLSLWAILSFLIQVLGVVQLPLVLKKRIHCFVFGGKDAILQLHERVLINVWEGILMRTLFETLPTMKALSVVLTFSDLDFQHLVLSERLLPTLEESADEDDEGSQLVSCSSITNSSPPGSELPL